MLYMYTKMHECFLQETSLQINAMKETHLEGSDRNTASPTESAVCERQGWEHSGADCLNFAIGYHRGKIPNVTRVSMTRVS